MKKNIFYALLANIVNAGFSWLMLIFLIRFGSKEDIGMFGLAQAIALPVHMFFTLKLRTIQLSDINNEFTETDYVGSRFFLSILNLIFVSLIAILFYFNKIDYILAIIALGLSYSAAIFREFYISIYQINEKNNYFFLSNLIQNFISLTVFIFSFLKTDNLIYSILIYSIFKLLLLIVDNIFYKKLYKNRIIDFIKNIFKKENKIFNLFKIALPLGLTSIVGALFTSIPRLELEKYFGLKELGVFTTLMSLVVFINLFMSSFIQAILPRTSKSYIVDRKLFLKQIIGFFILITCFLILIIFLCKLFSYYILLIIFGLEYTEYQYEFLLAMISGCILCFFHFGNFLLNVQREYKIQIYIYIFSAISCLISAHYFIPSYSVIGAIYSTIICSLMGFILSIIIFTKSFINKG